MSNVVKEAMEVRLRTNHLRAAFLEAADKVAEAAWNCDYVPERAVADFMADDRVRVLLRRAEPPRGEAKSGGHHNRVCVHCGRPEWQGGLCPMSSTTAASHVYGSALTREPTPEPTQEPVGLVVSATFPNDDVPLLEVRTTLPWKEALSLIRKPLYASPPVAQEGERWVVNLASRLSDLADIIVNGDEMDATDRNYACHDLRMASKRLNPSAYPADNAGGGA